MALALGLGSLFNHSATPNLSFIVDAVTESIRYLTIGQINPGDELCIFYGHNLWFQPLEISTAVEDSTPVVPDEGDGWSALPGLDEVPLNPFDNGDPTETIAESDLPFIRYRPPPEEEEMETIRTIEAWAVDIPKPQHITTLLKWLKQSGLETSELGHLKRIRKQESTTLLLTTSETPPPLPGGLDLSEPYIVTVPASYALTTTSLALKSTLWPTVFAPRRKDETEPWSRAKVCWAWKAMQVTVQAAMNARVHGELPIAAHVPVPIEGEGSYSQSFTAHDTRISTHHPLRHAAINVTRQIADHSSSTRSTSMPPGNDVSLATSLNAENGVNYLLTGLTLFITHEPCIMCSMALLHSRVKEIVYLYPMIATGGCGGVACLPTLQGVNHRFHIFRWKVEDYPISVDLSIDSTIDA
ncbi:cytidine deaminase-like protein [Pluteus cervinus]|uniref:Cytidine deaminase-like protein n=1 Tax=Pluteus cervinus TaxID=181527 RepID=A0ACD3B6X4_9AGAR|nr:cytidine deaminase-like protein [Pluteus cervinus]